MQELTSVAKGWVERCGREKAEGGCRQRRPRAI